MGKGARVRRFASVLVTASLLALGLPFVPLLPAAPAKAAPVLTAIKSDALVVDTDGDGAADPGDTLRYTIEVSNPGDMDVTGAAFSDTIDANTTLDAGSIDTTPIARSDTYQALGNVGITVPTASGVLANDNDPDGDAVTVVAAAGGTTQGGAFAIASDGGFSYSPPAGFEGVDSFVYNAASDGDLDPATVFITVSDMIWFVDAAASAGGDGRLSSPFIDLAVTADSFDVNAADSAGDVIFVADGSYNGGLTLLSNQKVIGDGSSSDLATVAGLTVPPHSNVLPAFSGTDPVITSTANGINLDANNTVRGLTIGNTTGTGLAGSGVGTLTVAESTINGTGGGVDVATGTLAVTLDALSASSATDEGIRLNNVSGSFAVTATNGTISTSNVPAVDIDGNPTLSLSLTMESISATNAANGILVQDTTGSFAVTGTGTTDGSGGTISDITNRGVSFVNSANVSLSNMTFTDAATANGGLCTGGDNSGCNAAIHLDATSDVTLTNVDITNTAQQGINGRNVTNFVLADSTVTQCGNEVNEGCLRMVNLAGTAAITNSDLSFPAERVAQIANTGVTLGVVISNSTFRDTQSSGLGADGLEITSSGASDTTIDIEDSSFVRNRTNGLQIHSEDTSIVSADVTGSIFDRDTGIGIGMDLAAADTATLHFNVVNNPLINSNASNAVNVFAGNAAVVQGRINSNPDIQVGGPMTSGFGIRAQANETSTMALEIDGNTISNIGFDAGIQVISRAGSGRVDATINNNNVTVDATSSPYDIWVQAQDANTTCANVTNNTASAAGVAAFRVRTVDVGSTVILEGAGATAAAVWSGNGNAPAAGPVSSSHNGTLSLGGTCNTVTHPALSIAPLPAAATAVARLGATAGASQATTAAVAKTPNTSLALPAAVAPPDDPISQLLSGETLNITLGTLNPGQVVVITFDVTVDSPIAATQVCNQGLVTATNLTSVVTDDPDTGTANDPTCTEIDAAPELSVTKDDGDVTARPGHIVTYTIEYENSGGSATGVVLTDEVPANTTFNPASSTGGWGCSPDNTAGSTCTLNLGSIAAGGGGTVDFAVNVDNPLPAGVTQITNTVSIDDDHNNGTDPTPGNNSATDTTSVNRPPVADAGGPYNVDEGASATLDGSGSSDPDGDTLTYEWDLDNDGNYDDATGVMPTFSAAALNGPTSVTVGLKVTDPGGLSDEDTASVNVTNAPPTVTVSPATQTVQYSDAISDVTVTASDYSGDYPLSATTSWSVDGGGYTAGLPTGLTFTGNGCNGTCGWTLSGVADFAAGVYVVRVSVSDDDGGSTTADITITVVPEDATVNFDDSNPVAVEVAGAGDDSGPFTLTVTVEESEPDLPADKAMPGDISLAGVTVTLIPVGPGGTIAGSCSDSVAGTGYSAVLTVDCMFNNVSVNTYVVDVTVNGDGYYTGAGEDVLVVYDPSLGFTTGGGWFYWPGTDDKTNFGYTMKYNKKGKKVKGSLLMIRHTDTGNYRVKSNALYGLAIGSVGGADPFGWASFSGKATYSEPGWPEPEGNHEFIVYVEDRGSPGAGADRFWIEVRDKRGDVITASSMPTAAPANATSLEGGNIVVPHQGGGRGRR